ncbi:hypothetical protein I302_105478 [Kwoniella bestiolae CBS 10118]|uniref:Uncharacterized protein n=1 Tax=Kwoniella bestiolae CBS 10118 TaxID=1296100 RepID=A0AAJ8K9V7_9TREE
MFTQTISLLALAALSAQAIVTPTSPDSNTVVKVGEKINALWTVDSVDNWNDVSIQLMTGDNLQMVPLATVAEGIDGTKVSSYSFDAPDVSPYSKIYFLQFTNGGIATNATWTTRFTIAGADGSATAPEQSTVYSGTTVEWGTGTLLSSVSTDGSSSSNSTSTGTTSSNSTSGTGAGSSVTTVSVSDTSSSTSASASENTSTFTSGTASGSGSKTVAAAAATSASASASGSSSGAGKKEVGLGMMLLAGLVGLAVL